MLYGLCCINFQTIAIRRIVYGISFMVDRIYTFTIYCSIILGLIGFLYCIITIVIPEFIKAIYKGLKGEKYER